MKPKFTLQDYLDALDGAGPKLQELVLERAAHDAEITLPELRRLVDKAYPDSW